MTPHARSPADNRPKALLFLVADTGGGHRSVAEAVTQAIDVVHPGGFTPVLVDPLAGPEARALPRLLARLYGPVTRHAPRTWAAICRGSSLRAALGLIQSTLLTLADAVTSRAVARYDPAMIVSFHPLLNQTAVRASQRQQDGRLPVTTVVTDLITAHRAWRDSRADLIAVPSQAVRRDCRAGSSPTRRCVETGLPVTSGLWTGPIGVRARQALRSQLGVSSTPFLVLLVGGAEGSGDIRGQATSLLTGTGDTEVVAICGRNRNLRRRLDKLAAQSAGRLTVRGFVRNMADWLRAADLVVSKAGPSTIAEATCCGAPLILTSYLPGQEQGNVQFVTSAGAGLYAPTNPDLVDAVDELRNNPLAVDRMRRRSARLGRPDAAIEVASLITQSVNPASPQERPA